MWASSPAVWVGHLAAARCLTSLSREAQAVNSTRRPEVIFWQRAVIPRRAGRVGAVGWSGTVGSADAQGEIPGVWEEDRSPKGGHPARLRCVSVCPGHSATAALTLPTLGTGEGSGRRRVFPASSLRSAPSLRRDPAPKRTHAPPSVPAPIRPFPRPAPADATCWQVTNRSPSPARPKAARLRTADPPRRSSPLRRRVRGPSAAATRAHRVPPENPAPNCGDPAAPAPAGPVRPPLTFVVSWWGEALAARAAGALKPRRPRSPAAPLCPRARAPRL